MAAYPDQALKVVFTCLEGTVTIARMTLSRIMFWQKNNLENDNNDIKHSNIQ
jgi:hypothetical protein